MSIQFGGLASGLDTNAIISALLSVERIPIQRFEGRKEEEQNRISLIGTLEGLVKDLREKAQGLATDAGFFSYALDGADDGVATFSLGSNPQPGSHTLQVDSLAAADRYAWDAGLTDADTTQLGGGTIGFTYDGTAYSVTVDAGTSTLNDVAAAINSQAGEAVRASVVNTGTEANPNYQLVVAGNDTGEDFALGGLSVSIAGLGAGTRIVAASNASVVIDGLAVERSGNVFSDVLPGVTFTVHTAGAATSFSVDVDDEGTKAKIGEFVDAYNEVIDFINAQSQFSEEDGPSGGLFGDSILTSVRGGITGALFNVDVSIVAADTEGYSTLQLIGIEIDSDGRLSIDDAKFDEKLSTNREAIFQLFSDEDSGLMGKLETALDALLDGPVDENGDPFQVQGKNIGGVFDRRRDTLNRNISRIDDDIERLERRIDSLEETLVQRFANLERIMSGLNAQSGFLASFPTFT